MTLAASPIALSAIASPAAAAPGGGTVTTTVALPLRVAVGSANLFAFADRALAWSATVRVGGVDISSRLTGRLSIRAAEDSARAATFTVIPETVSQFESWPLQSVTIDITLQTPDGQGTFRRFTGTVESVSLNPATREATLDCRDGYQERPAACRTAPEVEALFAGLAYPCQAVLPWNAAAPDAAAYFSGLADTFAGSLFIDGSGLWRAVPWAIGTPAATFAAGDVFDDSISVNFPNKRDLPASIAAALTLRYKRLHAVELALAWSGLEKDRLALDGCTWPLKSTVQQALAGLSGWYVKGEATLTGPLAGVYPIIHAGTTTYFTVSEQVAAAACIQLSATLYARWFQEVDKKYTVAIALGGLSDRDESIAASVASGWDAGAWESAAPSAASIGIYSANAPAVATPPTGYEGLPAPHPAANGALDHCPDVTPEEALAHVCARAVKRAAQGLRQRTVSFDKPLDLRFDIGSVLALAATGITATGQVIAFADDLDHDTGEAVTRYTLACPDGNGTTTGFVLPTVPALGNTVSHALTAPTLINWVGASTETADNPPAETVTGWLCNVLPTADSYAPAKPVYEEQFRIVMPEVSGSVRDPLQEPVDLALTTTIASGSLVIGF